MGGCLLQREPDHGAQTRRAERRCPWHRRDEYERASAVVERPLAQVRSRLDAGIYQPQPVRRIAIPSLRVGCGCWGARRVSTGTASVRASCGCTSGVSLAFSARAREVDPCSGEQTTSWRQADRRVRARRRGSPCSSRCLAHAVSRQSRARHDQGAAGGRDTE